MTDFEVGYPPTVERWFRKARRELTPKLRGSAMYVGLVPEDPDPKYCMELGMALMLDKPIILVVAKGRTLPQALRRAADVVIEDVDFDHPERDQERVQWAVTQALYERGLAP